jgi:hypothetical protein
MQYDVRLVKLVSGDVVIGVYDENEKKLKDIAMVQAIPNPGTGSVQIAILPFGFPYDNEIGGEIEEEKILYNFNKVPEDLKNKYLEEKSNIKITSAVPNVGGQAFKKGNSSGGLIL